MGAIADAIVAFSQPLLDQTDGSEEQLDKAFALSTLCYNLALLPEEELAETLNGIRGDLGMDNKEFDAFRRDVVMPMIRRHHEMFPRMHQRRSSGPWETSAPPRAQPRIAECVVTDPPPGRYAPCPCNSGRKYKFCCGAKGR